MEGGEGGHQLREPGLPGPPLCSCSLSSPAAAAGLLGEPALDCRWASSPWLPPGCSAPKLLPWSGVAAAAAAAAGSSTAAHPRSSLPSLVLAGVLAPLRPAASRSASSFRSLSPPPMALLSALSGGPSAATAAAAAVLLPSASAKPISPSSSASCPAGSCPSAAAPPVLLLLAPCAARRSTVTAGRCEGCSPAPTPAKLAGPWPPSSCSTAPSCSRAGGGGGGGTPTGCCCCR